MKHLKRYKLFLEDNEQFYHYQFDPTQKEIQIVNPIVTDNQPLQSFGEQLESLYGSNFDDKIEFAMNCALYKPDGKNVGALNLKDKNFIPKNLEKNDGNFSSIQFGMGKRNGVLFTLDKKNWSIVPTKSWNGDGYYAIQNGPILIYKGKINSNLDPKSDNFKTYRNGVGIDSNGNLHFALSKSSCNFWQLSNFLFSKGCVNALFCDASVSSIFNGNNIIGDNGDTGPMFVIEKKTKIQKQPGPILNLPTVTKTDPPANLDVKKIIELQKTALDILLKLQSRNRSLLNLDSQAKTTVEEAINLVKNTKPEDACNDKALLTKAKKDLQYSREKMTKYGLFISAETEKLNNTDFDALEKCLNELINICAKVIPVIPPKPQVTTTQTTTQQVIPQKEPSDTNTTITQTSNQETPSTTSSQIIKRTGDPYEYKVVNDHWLAKRKKSTGDWFEISGKDYKPQFQVSINILDEENPQLRSQKAPKREK